MQDKLLQTPDGVRDTYDVECKKKRKVMHELHHILELYSYHDIAVAARAVSKVRQPNTILGEIAVVAGRPANLITRQQEYFGAQAGYNTFNSEMCCKVLCR